MRRPDRIRQTSDSPSPSKIPTRPQCITLERVTPPTDFGQIPRRGLLGRWRVLRPEPPPPRKRRVSGGTATAGGHRRRAPFRRTGLYFFVGYGRGQFAIADSERIDNGRQARRQEFQTVRPHPEGAARGKTSQGARVHPVPPQAEELTADRRRPIRTKWISQQQFSRDSTRSSESRSPSWTPGTNSFRDITGEFGPRDCTSSTNWLAIPHCLPPSEKRRENRISHEHGTARARENSSEPGK